MGDRVFDETSKRDRAGEEDRPKKSRSRDSDYEARRWLSAVGNQAMQSSLDTQRYRSAFSSNPLERQQEEEAGQQQDATYEQHLQDIRESAAQMTNHDIVLHIAEWKRDVAERATLSLGPEVDIDLYRKQHILAVYEAELQKRPEAALIREAGDALDRSEYAEREKSESQQSAYDELKVYEEEIQRRRTLPVARPTTVAEAISLFELARLTAEGSRPGRYAAAGPHTRRAFQIAGVVNAWLQEVASSERMSEEFGGKAFALDSARMLLGGTKGNVGHVWAGLSPRGGWTSAGHWDLAITSLKASRDMLKILNREQEYARSETAGVMDAMKKGAAVTVVAVPTAAVGGGLAGWGLAAGATAAAPVIASEAGLFSTAVRTGITALPSEAAIFGSAARMAPGMIGRWWLANPVKANILGIYLGGQGMNMIDAGGPVAYWESLQENPLQLLTAGMEAWQTRVSMGGSSYRPPSQSLLPGSDPEPAPLPRSTPAPSAFGNMDGEPPAPIILIKPIVPITPPDMDPPTATPTKAPAAHVTEPPKTTPPVTLPSSTNAPPVQQTPPAPQAQQWTWSRNPSPQLPTTVTTPTVPLTGLPNPLPAGGSPRGMVVEPAVLQQRYPNATPLPPNFDTFDAIEGGQRVPIIAAGTKAGQANPGIRITGGRAISVKSLDVTGKSYQTADDTYKALKPYVNHTIDFDAYNLSRGKAGQPGRYTVTLRNPSDRILHLELTGPPGPGMIEGLRRLATFATDNNIQLVVVAPSQ